MVWVWWFCIAAAVAHNNNRPTKGRGSAHIKLHHSNFKINLTYTDQTLWSFYLQPLIVVYIKLLHFRCVSLSHYLNYLQCRCNLLWNMLSPLFCKQYRWNTTVTQTNKHIVEKKNYLLCPFIICSTFANFLLAVKMWVCGFLLMRLR